MKLRETILSLVVLLAVACSAMADHDILIPYTAAEGTATIDGDLSDWADADWIVLDEIYDPVPSDMSGARYAVRWNDADNVILLAVEMTDTEHVLSPDYASWNAHDDIEVSIDGGNHDVEFLSLMGYGQQIVVGADGAGGDWIIASWYNAVTPDLAPAYAAAVNGDVLSYELSIVPHSFYAGWGATDDAGLMGSDDTVVVDLAPGVEIGLDVVAVTAYDGGYGMMTNNLTKGKYHLGSSLQAWVMGGVVVACPGDANLDGGVDIDDFVILKGNFGSGTTWAEGDFDSDGDVDIDDFVILKNNFGSCE